MGSCWPASARAPTLVEVKSPAAGRVTKKGSTLTLHSEDVDSREYQVPHSARLRVETGDEVLAGHPLTEGSLNPKDLLQIKGVDTVQRFLVAEVQKVYRSRASRSPTSTSRSSCARCCAR